MTVPTVSIVMPVYNAERYVAESVNSILAQTYKDFEFIIINDGSTDGTHQILMSYASADDRVKLISRPNTGIVGALNDGLAAVRGHYVARMDSDDLALPQRLDEQVRFLDEHHDVVILGTDVLIIDADGDAMWTDHKPADHDQIDAALLSGRSAIIVHPAAMMRRDAVEKIGPYRPDTQWVEDLDYFLRLGEIGRLANLSRVLLKYRLHPQSVNHRRRQEQQQLVEQVLLDACDRRGIQFDKEKFVGMPPIASHDAQHRDWALKAYGCGHHKNGRKHGLKAVRCNPWSIHNWRTLGRVMLAGSAFAWFWASYRMGKRLAARTPRR